VSLTKHAVNARNAYSELRRYRFFCDAVTPHLHDLHGHRPSSWLPPSVLAFGLPFEHHLAFKLSYRPKQVDHQATCQRPGIHAAERFYLEQPVQLDSGESLSPPSILPARVTCWL
jgi:hypothetical protein